MSLQNQTQRYFQTSLLAAATSGSTSECRLLLEAGSDVGERSNSGLTPLLLAAYFGHAEVCELLLERGKANIEETEPLGSTALNLAAMEGHASTMTLLLSKGSRVDTRNKSGFSPLLVNCPTRQSLLLFIGSLH